MKYNFKYAKLNEGKLEFAPNILFADGVQIINATAKKYAECGYSPVERNQQPEAKEGFYFTPTYTEADGRIVQAWQETEIPQTNEATEADYINALEDLGVKFNE